MKDFDPIVAEEEDTRLAAEGTPVFRRPLLLFKHLHAVWRDAQACLDEWKVITDWYLSEYPSQDNWNATLGNFRLKWVVNASAASVLSTSRVLLIRRVPHVRILRHGISTAKMGRHMEAHVRRTGRGTLKPFSYSDTGNSETSSGA